MKKLSFVLALILACGMLASCGDDSETDTSTPTSSGNNAPTSSTAATSSETPTSSEAPTSSDAPDSTDGEADPSTPAEGDGDEEKPQDELIDASRFTVDGDISDWADLHTMVLQGEAATADKSATFYGAMTTEGLYLACDAYHDVYTTGKDAWFTNSNFEIFIETSGEQLFVYATGIGADPLTGAGGNATGKITSAAMVTTEINDATKYHTITEVFISNDDLPEEVVYLNTVSVGVAWKTETDMIIGGQYHINEDGSDEYWVVRGEDADGQYNANNCPMVATPKGLYWFEDYFED